MTQPSKFKKSNFYITLVCNYWTIISTLQFIVVTIVTLGMYLLCRHEVHIAFFLVQWILGVTYYIYYNYGMIGSSPKRKKMYKMLAESIELNKPFRKSMVYEMMHSRCENHIIKTLEKNYGIKLV